MPPEQKRKGSKDITKWGPLTAVIGTICAYIFSQLILIIPIALIAAINQSTSVSDKLDESAWLSLCLTGLSSLAMLFILWMFLKVKRAGLKDLGFTKIRPSDLGWLLIGLVAYFVLLALSLFIANLIPGFNGDQAQEIGYKNAVGWQIGLAFVGLVVVPPLAEEMLFRGYLYGGMASRWPKVFAALISSLLFALVHFQWNVGVDVFMLSLILIFLYEKTKNLWVCVGLHALKNMIAFSAIFVFVGR